jgi:hypothetical protein
MNSIAPESPRAIIAYVMPPSALMASNPCVPSVAVPDRMTPIACSRRSAANASRK